MQSKKYFTKVIDTTPLATENKAFLKTIPARSAEIMCKAIDDAILGKTKFLHLVRLQRITEFTPDLLLDISTLSIPTQYGDITAKIYRPKTKTKSTVIYLHGGGWTIGSVYSCQKICNDIAIKTSSNVIALEYSLSPEIKFPQPVHETFQAYKWIIENTKKLKIPKKNIFISGDSAGGNLALSTTIKSIENNIQLPKGLILFYPVTTVLDETKTKSWQKYGKNSSLHSDVMSKFTQAYLASDAQRCSLYASPILYDRLDEFPATLLISSGYDILHDQIAEFAKKFYISNKKLRYVDIKNAMHTHITIEGMPKAYEISLCECVNFINTSLGNF